MRGIAAAVTLAALLAGGACSPSAPPRQAPPAGAGAAPGRGGLDPDAFGLDDLARVSRHVFRTMTTAGAACTARELPPGSFSYVIAVEVRAGRIQEARLASVTAQLDGAPRPLAETDWPPALRAQASCLRPHLLRIVMLPAPADGVYPTEFLANGPPAATASKP